MKKGNPIALAPIGVFLAVYLGLGLLFEYGMKIPMGFYNIPIVIAFLVAILVACIQNRAVSFDEKLELMGRGLGYAVFSQAISHGISMGYRTFRLLVVTDFLRGIRIYEKFGFRRVGKADLWENEYYLYEYSCPRAE